MRSNVCLEDGLIAILQMEETCSLMYGCSLVGFESKPMDQENILDLDVQGDLEAQYQSFFQLVVDAFAELGE